MDTVSYLTINNETREIADASARNGIIDLNTQLEQGLDAFSAKADSLISTVIPVGAADKSISWQDASTPERLPVTIAENTTTGTATVTFANIISDFNFTSVPSIGATMYTSSNGDTLVEKTVAILTGNVNDAKTAITFTVTAAEAIDTSRTYYIEWSAWQGSESLEVLSARQAYMDGQIKTSLDARIDSDISATLISAKNYVDRNDSIDTPQITNKSVTTEKLANLSVTTSKLDEGAVVTEKLDDSSVTAQKLAQNAVTTAKLAGGSVTDDKLDPGGVISDLAVLKRAFQNLDVTVDPNDFSLEQDPDTGLVYVTYRGERSENGIPLAGGGGSGGSSSTNNAVITVTNTSGWLSRTIGTGSSCIITLNWSSIEDELATGDGTMTITVGGVLRSSQNVSQGTVSIDVGPFMNTGSNKVRIRIADVYDNARTITFMVNCEDLYLSSSFDTSMAFTAGQSIEFVYNPKGAVEKTIHFAVDGVELSTEIVTVSGRQQSKILPGMTHGHHTLRVWFTVTIDSQTVNSNELFYDLIVVDASTTTPIIAIPFNQTTASEYELLSIPYSVYTPNTLTSAITLKANGVTVQQITVGRGEHIWNYRCQSIGELTLSIETGEVIRQINLTVSASDIAAHAETEGLQLYLTSYGRSNNEDNPGIWVDNDNDISCTMSGFNFQSNGWVTDPDGYTVLRINNGASVTIPYQPFATDFRSTGKTLEFEFAARDVLDYNAAPISCMNGGRGFQLTAQKALLKSEQSEISTQFKEDEHVRVSFVAEKRTEDRLLLIYINGIVSGAIQYPAGDDFSQQTPVDIVLGDDDITLDIYNIRVYNHNLTRYQILDNWIADTQDISVMLQRYTHNSIYDEYGKVVIEKLPKDLPYFILEAEQLPQYKGDKKTISGSYVDPQNSSKSFTFTNCQINVQGTSSAPYARKNYDMQFKGGFELPSGHSDNYQLAANIVPFNRFVVKADVASSEGANNVELVKLYCETNPVRRREQENDPRIRWGIYGFPIVIFWHNTQNGETSFLGKYNFNLPKRAPEPYGYSGNMESWEFQNNTSDLMLFKTTEFDETMITDPSTGDTKEAWRYDYEARFPSDEWTDYSKLQEFHLFIDSTNRSKATGDTLAESVVYNDVTYTNDTAAYRLAKFKNEFGKYAEVNSFIFYYIFTELFLMVDSRAKNLFIGFSGSDTTGLNIIDRKAVAEPYDMDTAIGTNNEGSLVFSYNLEDTDHMAGNVNVFNGQESILWNNVRDAFPAEITTMYQQLRSAGTLSYSNVEQQFENHQAKWPEAIFNEDAWFKYLSPLIDPDEGKEPTDVYLPMMQGSKAEQRKWWLYNRFRYMDSKWNAGDALSDVIQLRGYAKADITVTPYADIYPTVKYGSYLVSTRGTHDVPETLTCPLDNVNDTEIYIYSAPQIASVGDLSPLKVGFADFSKATKLQSIKVGSSTSGYVNPNLTGLSVGQNNLLNTVDASNCIALTGTIDLSGAANIENVYMEGTAISGVDLPIGGILKTLHLPASVTNITIRGHKEITSFSVTGNDYSNVSTLRIEDCGSVIPIVDILKDMPASSRVRITGFEMNTSDISEIEEFYDYLDTMRGLDESGNNVNNAVVVGTITGLGNISGAWYAEMKSRYPNIEIEYEHITSVLYYCSWDGQTIVNQQTILDGGDGTYTGTVSRASTAQYNYTFIGWSLSMDSLVADSNATKNVVGDRRVYAAYSGETRTYTVTFKNSAGTILQTVSNVPYGSSATYTGQTPVGPNEYDGVFEGWDPSPENITGNTTCIAQFKDMSSKLTGIIERTIKRAESEDVTEIRDYAFAYCYSLSSINFPNVNYIGNSVFYSCSKLSSINLPNVVSIGSSAFDLCYNLSSISLPNVSYIGDAAFQRCFSLSSISLPNVSYIGGYVFAYCSNLSSISLPNISYIGGYAFQNCYNLTSISSPKVETIGYAAFSNCYNLSSINLPNVSYIGNEAFYSCYRLMNFYIGDVSSVPLLNTSNIFIGTPIGGFLQIVGENNYGSIYVPASLYDAFISASNWSIYSSRIVSVS